MKHLSFLPVILFFITSIQAQPLSWSSKGIGGGGALFAPSINPSNNNEYYISCDMSELFHTTDFGRHYSQLPFQQFVSGHNSRMVYTSTTDLLYSLSYFDDVATPVKSTDNGVTWSKISGNPDPSEEVFSLYADYKNPQRIVMATYGAVFFSSNGGTSFTSIHTASDNGAGNVIGGVFFDGNTIYIGTNDGVLVSANGGANWSVASLSGLPANERIWSFCAGKSGGITRFFCLTGDAADIYAGKPGSDYYDFMKGIYSCDYGTGNWVAKETGISKGSDFPFFIDMAENTIDTVFIAGSNLNSEPVVMKTNNAGGNWSHVFKTTTNNNIITGWSGAGGDRGWSYGEAPFGMDVAATNSQTMIFGDFGFCHKTNDGGKSWSQAYIDEADQHPANANIPAKANYHSIGLENTTCWQVHWMNNSSLWASYSDIRGIRSDDGGASWSFNYAGNTANSTYRVAQSGSTLFAATSNIHDMYQSTRLQDNILDGADAHGKILYSTDNGLNWALLHNFNHPVFWIVLDPNNPKRAYASVIHYNGGAGVGGVYRCDDLDKMAASTWTLLPAPTRTEKHPACLVVLNDGKLVATFSGRRNSGGVFTASSGCFVYDPVANNWSDVSDPGMHYWTKDVVIDPNDTQQNTWYVGVFSGWGGAPNGLGGLYKTTNRGQSWKKITGTTLDRVTSCTFNPSDANQLYITTEVQGLWTCNNINAPTPSITQVINYPFRQPERVFFNPYNKNEIWVSSFGNGMKMGTLTVSGIPSFTGENKVRLYPQPANATVNIEVDEEQSADVYNLQGQLCAHWKLLKGVNALSVDGWIPGVYVLTAGFISIRWIVCP